MIVVHEETLWSPAPQPMDDDDDDDNDIIIFIIITNIINLKIGCPCTERKKQRIILHGPRVSYSSTETPKDKQLALPDF